MAVTEYLIGIFVMQFALFDPNASQKGLRHRDRNSSGCHSDVERLVQPPSSLAVTGIQDELHHVSRPTSPFV